VGSKKILARLRRAALESLSGDKDNTFFADGVYDGVFSKLAK
jgi:hypothetical protein